MSIWDMRCALAVSVMCQKHTKINAVKIGYTLNAHLHVCTLIQNLYMNVIMYLDTAFCLWRCGSGTVCVMLVKLFVMHQVLCVCQCNVKCLVLKGLGNGKSIGGAQYSCRASLCGLMYVLLYNYIYYSYLKKEWS